MSGNSGKKNLRMGLRRFQGSNPNSVFLREVMAIPRDPPAGWENGQCLTGENVGRRNVRIYN